MEPASKLPPPEAHGPPPEGVKPWELPKYRDPPKPVNGNDPANVKGEVRGPSPSKPNPPPDEKPSPKMRLPRVPVPAAIAAGEVGVLGTLSGLIGAVGISRGNAVVEDAARANVGLAPKTRTPFMKLDVGLEPGVPTVPRTEPSKNVQVKDPCQMDRFGNLHGKCPPGYEAHHVPPQFTMKYGSAKNRSSEMPELNPNDAMAICLKGRAETPGTEHNLAQQALYQILAKMGGDVGYAPFEKVLDASIDEVAKVRKKSPEWDACVEKLRKKAKEMYQKKLSWPLRTTRNPPGFPTSDNP